MAKVRTFGTLDLEGMTVGKNQYNGKVHSNGDVEIEGELFPYKQFRKLTLNTHLASMGEAIGEAYHRKTLYKEYFKKVCAIEKTVRGLSRVAA